MKSPDYQKEESMRGLMSRRFESYEKEPSAQLTQSVFDQLRKSRRHRTLQILLAAFLLIGIGIGVALLSVNKQRRQDKRRPFASTQRLPLRKQPAAVSGGTPVSKSAVSQMETLYPLESTGLMAVKTKAKSSTKSQNPMLAFDSAIRQTGFVAGGREQAFLPENLAGARPLALTAEILNSKLVFSNEHALAMSAPVSQTRQAPPGRGPEDRGGFLIVGLVPTNSFQMLDVIPKDGFVYQNFRFPKPVQVQSLGYKFQMGIEKQGVQLLMSYSQFSHSVTYEVAGSEFMLVRDSSNGTRPVRKTTTVHDKNALRQMGFALKKHLLFSKGAFKSNYFDLGAEFTKQLGGRNNALWLNASFGREIQMPGRTSLAIGPYIEYSLRKFESDSRVYVSTPYQLGVSLSLRLSDYNKRKMER